MAITYPGTLDVFTNPVGTNTLNSPDHATQHSDENDAIEAIQVVVGTTAGTNVLKNFAAGQFPARVNVGGTLVQTLIGGTINTTTFGTPTSIGGTYRNVTLGTPAITNGTATSTRLNSNIIGTPAITGGTATSTVLNSNVIGTPAITGGTANSQTLGTPTVVGGGFSAITIGTSAITGGTATSTVLNTNTIGTPAITGGTITSSVINSPTIGTPTVTGGSFASPTTTGTDSGTATLENKTIGLSNLISFNATEGFLINGKIVPSVATSDLTVAIKGIDGNDPSATNPVYVRIGDTIRSITSALSVTKNDATNWFNAGSAELATKEIDYFVYLGYNATDGVVIGFARIPYANLYSDFSTTTTNEKYCAISTITNADVGDTYVNIGRFAATLSAGAGYTWTVPTFTSANLIQRPIYETRSLLWTPQISAAGSMTISSVVNSTNRYVISFNKINFYLNFACTTGGTASNVIYATLPISCIDLGLTVIGFGNSADTINDVLIDTDGSTLSRVRIIHPGFANWGLGANRGVGYGASGAYQIN